MFIDNLFKIIRPASEEELSGFLSWLEKFGQSESITFTVTVSADPSSFGEDVTKYLYE